jgi:phospholipase/lecithinase/hemolysin
MLRRVFAASLLAIVISLALASQALSYTGLVAFGDSLSDMGNLCPTGCPFAPAPPYLAGRFSNGQVWVETLAAGLGLPLTASSVGGTNFAVGGATTSGVLSSQIPLYLSSVGGAASPTTLYTLLAGGNDGFSAVNPITAANNVVAALNTLKAAGAQNFLVGNLPDLSLVPVQYGIPAAQAFSNAFNAQLAAGLATITGVTIFGLDLYALTNASVANPGLYGFTNVNTACFQSPTVCATPGSYLFWDTIHPTAVAHDNLAQVALATIPEPGTASLLLLGLVVLASRRRSARR